MLLLLWLSLLSLSSSHETWDKPQDNCSEGTSYMVPYKDGTVLDPCEDGPCWTYCDHLEWHETEFNVSEFSEDHLKEDQYECLSSACTNFFYGHVNIQVLEECAHFKCLVVPVAIDRAHHCTAILLQGSEIYSGIEAKKVEFDRYTQVNRSLVEYGKHNFMYRVNSILDEQHSSIWKLELTVHDMNSLLEVKDPESEEEMIHKILDALQESIEESKVIQEHIRNVSSITGNIQDRLYLIERETNMGKTLANALQVVKEYLDQVRADILQIYVYDTDVCTSITSLLDDIEDECEICANGKCHFNPDETVFECTCDFGWIGYYCDVSINSCEYAPCQNGGKCFDEDDNFRCECPSSWVGKFCDIPVVEANGCALGPAHPCQNDAECTDISEPSPSYECACDFGWMGRNCQYAQKECAAANPCDNGQCNFNGTRLQCICPEEPIYRQPYYTGPTCSKEQRECDYFPDELEKWSAVNGKPCSGHGLCELDYGSNSWTCVCESTHIGLRCGIPVVEANKCTMYGIPCVNGDCAHCDSAVGCTCDCQPGFKGDDCSIAIDPCSPDPCLNNATCIKDSVEDFYCDCSELPGKYGGKRCEKTVTCADKPCGDHFISCNDESSDVSGIKCLCEAGYVGTRCEKKIETCSPTSCLNGGNCIQGMVGFCQCINGFSGDRCQHAPAFCDNRPCGSNGVCQLAADYFLCICDAGWDGTLCNNNIDDCDPEPCKNGGTCVDKVNGFACLCPDEWRGNVCEILRSPCDNVVCAGHGTCMDTSDEEWTTNEYECKCPSTTCRREVNIGGLGSSVTVGADGSIIVEKREVSYWLLITGCAAGVLFSLVMFGLYKYSHGGRKPRNTNKFIMMDMVN